MQNKKEVDQKNLEKVSGGSNATTGSPAALIMYKTIFNAQIPPKQAVIDNEYLFYQRDENWFVGTISAIRGEGNEDALYFVVAVRDGNCFNNNLNEVTQKGHVVIRPKSGYNVFSK